METESARRLSCGVDRQLPSRSLASSRSVTVPDASCFEDVSKWSLMSTKKYRIGLTNGRTTTDQRRGTPSHPPPSFPRRRESIPCKARRHYPGSSLSRGPLQSGGDSGVRGLHSLRNCMEYRSASLMTKRSLTGWPPSFDTSVVSPHFTVRARSSPHTSWQSERA